MDEPTGGLRAAFTIAVVIALASGGVLLRGDRSGKPDALTRGGTLADKQNLQDLTVATPTPTPLSTGMSHSSAVLSAPGQAASGTVHHLPDEFPPEGDYTYSVTGTESATAFGARDYPPDVTMTVSRPSNLSLPSDELVFDLPFSQDHQEREYVAYRKSGVAFAYESSTITFGPGVTQSDESNYAPAIMQVPLPLTAGEVRKGTSTATSPAGTATRVEEWKVTVLRQEDLFVLNHHFKTWVVQVVRDTKPGQSSGNKTHRTRTYWYSPEGNIWLKWSEDVTSSRSFGPGNLDYTSHYAATLESFQPR